jgi:hypothetical protein
MSRRKVARSTQPKFDYEVGAPTRCHCLTGYVSCYARYRHPRTMNNKVKRVNHFDGELISLRNAVSTF